MDGAIWGFVGVIVGGIITGLVTLGVELIRSGKETSLDSAKRRDDRQLGRDAFQREWLVALQDAIQALWMIREHGSPAELDGLLAIAKIQSRISDDEVRTLTETFLTENLRLSAAGSGDRELLGKVTGMIELILNRTGSLIRETFVEPTARMVEPVSGKPGISEPD